MSSVTPYSQEGRLFEACISGDIVKVKKLIEQGANLNISTNQKVGWDTYSYSPIHCALGMIKNSKLNIPIVHLLLEHGADINSLFLSSGWMTGGKVSQTGFDRVINLILKGEDLKLLDLVRGYGVNPNRVIEEWSEKSSCSTSTSYYMIHKVVDKNRPDILKILLELGTNSNAEFSMIMNSDDGERQDTKHGVLHFLFFNETFDYLSGALLVEYGCDINAYKFCLEQDTLYNYGYDPRLNMEEVKITPLQMAIKCYNISAVLFLLTNGANRQCPYYMGDQEYSLEEFIEKKCAFFDDQQKKYMTLALKGEWDPVLNKYYPEAFKEIVVNVLLCFSRISIPNEIVFMILGYLSHYPITYELMEKYHIKDVDR